MPTDIYQEAKNPQWGRDSLFKNVEKIGCQHAKE